VQEVLPFASARIWDRTQGCSTGFWPSGNGCGAKRVTRSPRCGRLYVAKPLSPVDLLPSL